MKMHNFKAEFPKVSPPPLVGFGQSFVCPISTSPIEISGYTVLNNVNARTIDVIQ